jgi:hypothetical protein
MNIDYEIPVLNQVGKTDDVILGILTPGADHDGTLMFQIPEFESDDSEPFEQD